MGENYDSS